jgi:hypothetical protein
MNVIQNFFNAKKASGALEPHIEVQIQKEDGEVYTAEFNGWYDFRSAGGGLVASIGRNNSHGVLYPGETILTLIPSFEEWQTIRRSFSAVSYIEAPRIYPVAVIGKINGVPVS